MSTLLDAWELYSSTILSEASIRSIITETGRWNKYVGPALGDKQLGEITSLDIIKFRSSISQTRLSPQTVYHCLSLIRKLMNKARIWGLFSGELPVFEMPKFDNKRVRFLTPIEVAKLLEYLRFAKPLWHDITIIALYTGLRAGEIFKLTTCDVLLEEGRVIVLDTKTNSNRTVPLNQSTKEAFMRHLNPASPSSPIFPVKCTRAFGRIVSVLGLNKGIEDRRHQVVFHTLRHTFASWLAQGGVPLAVVGHLLGHKTMKMTMRYALLAPNQAQDAINYLNTIDVATCQAENTKYSQTPVKSFWDMPNVANNDQTQPNAANHSQS